MIDLKFEKIKKFISETSKETSIYIGSDSKQYRDSTIFVTAVVIHIDSCRGAKIFYSLKKERKINSLRERLMKEVDLSVYTALNLLDCIDGRKLEIHLDLNPNENHKSNIAVRDAIGYVLSQGLKPVLKPNSIAAFSVADYLLKHL